MSYCTVAAPRNHVVQARVVNVAGAWVIITAPVVRITDGGALIVGEYAEQLIFGPGFWSSGRVIPEPKPPEPPAPEPYVEPIT